MPPGVAAIAYGLFILALFLVDRDRKSRVSAALWIPLAWVLIGASRDVSVWLGVAPILQSPDQILKGSPLDRLVLTGLLVAGLTVLLARGRRSGSFLWANGPLLLFLFYCASSVLWSDYPTVAFKRWIKFAGSLVMIQVVLTDPTPSAAVKWLLARAAFLLIPLSVLLGKYYPELGRNYHPYTWVQLYHGVAIGKNGLGVLCLVFGLGSLWRFLEAFRNGGRLRMTGPLIAHGAVLAMALWLFWKANSATSLGCFLIAGALMAVMKMPALARKPAAAHVLVLGIISVCLFGLFLYPESGLVQAMGRDTMLTGRIQLWETLIHIPVNPWFGVGFESFWLGKEAILLWSEFWWRPNQAHNGYLEVYLNLGWTGVGLLSLVMVWGWRNVVGSLRRDPELGRLRLAFFVTTVLYNLTEAAFKIMHPVWIAFLLAILVYPNPSAERTDEASTKALPSG
jgi:O-antigen ligase